jgi:methylmalonyl-CoA mutase
MDRETWRARAERELGRPIERLDYSPGPDVRVPALCTSSPPTSRGTSTSVGWQVVSSHAGIPETIADTVQEAVRGGADVLRIDVRLARGARDLGTALARHIDTHPIVLAHSAVGDAATLVALAQGLRKDLSTVQLDFALDPIGRLAREGFLQGPVERHIEAGADVGRWALSDAPRCSAFEVDGTVWFDAGADDAWSLAATLATGVAYLRALDEAEVPLERAFTQIRVRQAASGRFLSTVARLRALRRLVSRVAELSGARGTWRQTVCPSARERVQRDAPTNILRNTASAFAAITGGAQRVDLVPHEATPAAARLARNTLLVLRDEAHLGRVADPAGGAHALESLTDQLAAAAWKRFQRIEAEGGALAALQSGFLAEQITACREREIHNVRVRKHPIIGITRYPDLDAPNPPREPEHELPTSVPGGLGTVETFAELLPVALQAYSSELTHARVGGGLARARPLPVYRFAEPFERLRDKGARLERGVYVATLGPLREHSARTAFGREFVEVGGLRAHVDETVERPEQVVAALHASRAQVALVSCADGRFATEGVEAVRLLTQAGARVWMLGRPGEAEEALREAGARGFIVDGTDVHQTLLQLWEHA